MARTANSGDETRPLLQHVQGSRSVPVSPTKRGAKPLRTSRSQRYISGQLKARGSLQHSPSSIEKERVWYDNYTAIDFNRDQVLGARRLEKLRNRRGLRARIAYLYDAVQGWLLCFLIGILSATVAYCIMVSEVFLYSAKLGYCTSFIFSSQKDCKEGDFHVWQQRPVSKFILYAIIALAYALMASRLTMATLTVFPNGKKLYMAAGSGIPEIKTILGGFVIHGFLGLRTLIVKIVGLTLAVATGMSLGKEGPFVMISCCISNILTRFFSKFANNETKRREILSSACSAGVAVAFGSPVGGVLFALEEVSYYFPPKVMYRSFFCAAVAAVTLKTLNPHGTGKLILLQTNYEWKEWTTSELPIFLFLGLLGGLYGASFCYLNMAWSRSFRRMKVVAAHPICEVAAVCLVTSLVSYWNDFARMGGTELVDTLLSECAADSLPSLCDRDNTGVSSSIIRHLLVALIIKFALTVITFGIKVPAGIFIPTMCIGSIAGRIVGILLEQQYAAYPSSWYFKNICPDEAENCIAPGVYAMIGAAATLAGVTRMTVSLAVIMFELTGSLNYVMPYMIAILSAKWIADAIQPRGIYDLIIDLNDHPYINVKENHTFGTARLTDLLPPKNVLMRTCIDVTHDSCVYVSELRAKVAQTRRETYEDGGFPIIHSGRLVGYVSLADLSLALDLLSESADSVQIIMDPASCIAATPATDESRQIEDWTIEDLLSGNVSSQDLRPIIDRAPLTVQKEASLELATEMFTKLGLRYLAVLDGSKLLGIIHKKRFVKFLRGQS